MLTTAMTIALCAHAAPSLAASNGPQRLFRPDAPVTGEVFTFDPGDTVITHGTTSFVLHYTTAGTHAVPSGDVGGDGIPDHVQNVGAIYEEALDFYVTTLGFDAPVSDAGLASGDGGDGRIDVYLVDFAFQSDGSFVLEECDTDGTACTGYVVQENDFAGYGYPSIVYANRLVSSHELFHFVQAAYRGSTDVVLSEGTAVWATEQFDPALEDLEGFGAAFLAEPDRSIDVPPGGPVPAYAYGASVFFQFLSEHVDPAVIREIFEDLRANERPWLGESLPAVLEARGGTFAAEMAELAIWNLYTGDRADPALAYADASEWDLVETENTTLPSFLEELRVFHASTQYFEAPPGEREEVMAAFADGSETEGVRLFVAALDAGAVLDVREQTDGEDPVPTSGATSVVAFVVNVEPAGDSRRPSVCFGSPAEVADCASSGGGGGSGCGCALDGPAAGRPSLGIAILLASIIAAISRARVARR